MFEYYLVTLAKLLDNLFDLTRTYGATTLTDSETQTCIQSNGVDERYLNLNVVTGHYHLDTLGKFNLTGNIHSTEVELRTIVVAERSVTTTLFFLQDINLTTEFGVRSDALGFGYNHTTLNLFLVDTTHQQTYVITSLTLIEEFAEHLNTGTYRSANLLVQTDNLYGVTNVDNTSLNTAGNYGTTTGNREYVLNRHQEGLVALTRRQRNVLVYCVHKLENFLLPLGLTVQSTKCRTADNGSVVTVKAVCAQYVTNLHLNEVKHLSIVYHIALVHKHNDTGNVYLTSQQHVLTSLRHRTIGRSNNQDSTIHLSSTSYHILYIVGVAGAVYVSVVTACSLILNVSGVDGDTTLFLLGSVVDRVKRAQLRKTILCQYGSNSSGKSSFTVVNVADSTYVYVRF